MCICPLLSVAQGIQRNLTKKQMLEAASGNTDAQVLCSDAIANFKTVQSFGHEDMLVDLYVELNKD